MTDAKKYLEQIEKLDIMTANKLIEQQQWRDLSLSITAAINGDRVQTSSSYEKMANAANKCMDIADEFEGIIDELAAKKKEVIAVIEQVENPTEYDLLHRKYIQHIELKDIAFWYNREYNWATTTHGRALKSVQNILDKVSL